MTCLREDEGTTPGTVRWRWLPLPEMINPPVAGSIVTVPTAVLIVVSHRPLAVYASVKSSERTSWRIGVPF